MSDRIAVMNRGRVEQVADPEEVYERPATTFVAGFIGVSNLMPGESSPGRGEVRLDNGPTVRVPTDGLPQGERCHAVVRPEKLRIETLDAAGGAPGDGLPRVEGVVESSLYLGTATQIVVDLGGDVRMTVLVPNASEAERQRAAGRRRPGSTELGARAHARRPRVERSAPMGSRAEAETTRR